MQVRCKSEDRANPHEYTVFARKIWIPILKAGGSNPSGRASKKRLKTVCLCGFRAFFLFLCCPVNNRDLSIKTENMQVKCKSKKADAVRNASQHRKGLSREII